MIEVEGLTRTCGDFTAVDDVSFRIERGEIVGLLGHNGAGKATIMKMITGYLEPTAGRVAVDGIDLATDRQAVQGRIGYLPENCPVYPEMTVADYLDYTASLHGISDIERPRRVRTAIERTGLRPKATERISTLSRGFTQRVGVAQAILHEPGILILDEPTNGLDPTQIHQMRELVRDLAQNATVILSTHILQEVQAVCDRVIIIRQGKKALDERIDSLRDRRRLLVAVDAAPEVVRSSLDGVEGVEQVSQIPATDGRFEYSVTLGPDGSGDQAAAAIARRAAVEAGFQLYSLHAERDDLETVFGRIASGLVDALQRAAAVAGLGAVTAAEHPCREDGDVDQPGSSQTTMCQEAVTAFVGLSMGGFVLVPIVHIYGRKEVSFILEQSGAVAYLSPSSYGHVDYTEIVDHAAPASLRLHVVSGDPGAAAARSKMPRISWAEIDALSPVRDLPAVDAREPVVLAYTSGTTSDPKGVIHDHRTLLSELRHMSGMIVRGAPSLMGSPVTHATGMLGAVLGPLDVGNAIHVIDRWDPGHALEAMLEAGIGGGAGAAVFLSSLLDHPSVEPYARMIVADFPRTAAGKIRKVDLRARAIPTVLVERDVRRRALLHGRSRCAGRDRGGVPASARASGGVRSVGTGRASELGGEWRDQTSAAELPPGLARVLYTDSATGM